MGIPGIETAKEIVSSACSHALASCFELVFIADAAAWFLNCFLKSTHKNGTPVVFHGPPVMQHTLF